jgi:hypothetical protein
MKRQPRPFAVEIKSPRLRTFIGSLSSSSALQSFDPFPDDLLVRDMFGDLTQENRFETSHKSGAIREAERVFGGLKAAAVELSPAQSTVPSFPLIGAPDVLPGARTSEAIVPEPNGPAPEVRRPRVLPDLREQARPQDASAATEPVRPTSVERSSTRPFKRRSRPPAAAEGLAPPVPSPEPLAAAPVDGERLLPPASASLGHSRPPRAGIPGEQEQTRRRASGQLPRSERWKTRRLPRVCWSKPRGIWSQNRT